MNYTFYLSVYIELEPECWANRNFSSIIVSVKKQQYFSEEEESSSRFKPSFFFEAKGYIAQSYSIHELKSLNRALERNLSSKRETRSSRYISGNSTVFHGNPSLGGEEERRRAPREIFVPRRIQLKTPRRKMHERPSSESLGACTKLQLEDLSRLFRVWSSRDDYANNSCSLTTKVYRLAFPRRNKRPAAGIQTSANSFPASRKIPSRVSMAASVEQRTSLFVVSPELGR